MSKQIRTLLGKYQLDRDWMLPSRLDNNLLVWLLEATGMPFDVRAAPRAI